MKIQEWLQQKLAEADRTGILWLGGEMEVPINEGPAVALDRASEIAEACGYMAGWKYGRSSISITGGEIPGEVVLDWFDPSALKLAKLSIFSETAVYRDEVMELCPA